MANTNSGLVTTSVFGAGIASATEKYYFQVTGTGNDTIIPIIIEGALETHVQGPSINGYITTSSNAQISVEDNGSSASASVTCTIEQAGCNGYDGTKTFNSHGSSGYALGFSLHLNAPINSFGSIFLSARSAVSGSGNVTASADPYIFIDPTFANAGLYSITTSPNVLNSPVPLPAAAWLFGSGLLGLCALRRKKVKSFSLPI
jgi:hypothetical protein